MPDRVSHSSRGLLVAIATAMAVGGFGLLAGASAPAKQGCSRSGETVTCTYMSGSNRFKVPNGVSSIHVVAVGGAVLPGKLLRVYRVDVVARAPASRPISA
jgi:hypothetical protein